MEHGFTSLFRDSNESQNSSGTKPFGEYKIEWFLFGFKGAVCVCVSFNCGDGFATYQRKSCMLLHLDGQKIISGMVLCDCDVE